MLKTISVVFLKMVHKEFCLQSCVTYLYSPVLPTYKLFTYDLSLQSYAMRRLPRGKALIINVNEVEGKPPRRGTDIDRDNLYHLLRQLHFDVQVYNDKDGLTAKVRYLKTSLSGHQKSCML